MHESRRPIDPGRSIDWGLTADDYALYRPGYPSSFYQRLAALGVGQPGQRVLDLGTGTGVVARALARRGCRVTGIDIAEESIGAARRLADEEGLAIDFQLASAEETGLPNSSFDLVTAAQCWLYFDQSRAIPEVLRLLAPGGRLMTCHLCWLSKQDPIAQATEELVLRHNPSWTAAGWAGRIPEVPAWSTEAFTVDAWFWYDEPMPSTYESWRGRIRACRGVGASLPAEEVARFDAEHAALLRELTTEPFEVLHRIDCHLFAPRERTA